jgi:glyoxylase-like metal-dependent hydrolase (beta-lactamase superfamily II)
MPSEHGIHTIDTGFNRPHFDAAYLVVERGRAAFIDCGTNHSIPRLLDALQQTGLSPDAVDWLVLTHVHLDHAGGAGELMARLPHARLVVHPRGARHMIDPSRLWAGASAVYGEAVMERDYGRLRPIPAERVVEAPDGHPVDLAGRILTCLDTPGHARHHNAIWDPASGSCFTGDTFGLSYREFDTEAGAFIVPTTTPVQFDPDALHASIERLCALEPAALYPTHFGRIGDVNRLANDLHEQIDAMVAIALACDGREDRHAALVRSLDALFARRAGRHGWHGSHERFRELLGADIELDAQGLEVWLDRRHRET